MSSPAEALPDASSAFSSKSQSWLDRTAIFLAVLCGIHCLATPILLVALPLIANTFWVSEEFHLGMLLLVIPTSLLAAFAGCRQHRDRFVIGFIVAGLGVLTFATGKEIIGHSHEPGAEHALLAHGEESEAAEGCASCCPPAEHADEHTIAAAGPGFNLSGDALLMSFGGLLLALGHTRNFLLCRRHKCDHTHEH